jgi:hypothetical protein
MVSALVVCELATWRIMAGNLAAHPSQSSDHTNQVCAPSDKILSLEVACLTEPSSFPPMSIMPLIHCLAESLMRPERGFMMRQL